MLNAVHENVAKLMAVENITVIQNSESTASFDTERRILTIPNWKNISEEIIEMLVCHEIGHALYTPTEEWIDGVQNLRKDASFKQYLNIVEDARIERVVKNRYPGTKKIFYTGYKQIIEKKIMPIDDVRKLNTIDRINVWFKLGGIVSLDLTQQEMLYVKRIEAATTFEEVKNIALEIFDNEKNKSKTSEAESSSKNSVISQDNVSGGNQQEPIESTNPVDPVNPFELMIPVAPVNPVNPVAPLNPIEPENIEAVSSDNQELQNPKSDSDSDEDSESPTLIPESIEGSESSSQNPDSDVDLESETLSALEQNLKDLVSSEDMVYVCIPDPILENVIVPYSKIMKDLDRYEKNNPEDYSSFKKKNQQTIALHKQLFEMRKRAKEYSRTSIHKTGVLNTNLLHTYKFNDNVFKTHEVKENGKKHALVFIMDFSGSMKKYLKDAKKKAMELISFCKSVDIPYSLYLFVDNYYGDKKVFDTQKCFQKFDWSVYTNPNFRLLNIFDSSMSETDFKKMYSIFMKIGETTDYSYLYSLSGTPLVETHLCLDALVSQTRKKTSAQVVNVVYLTDGDGYHLAPVDKNGSVRYFSKKLMLHDPKTKKNYKIGASYITPELALSVMKGRLQSVNIINFFITKSILLQIPQPQMLNILDKEFNYTTEKQIASAYHSDFIKEFDEKYLVVQSDNSRSFDTQFICSTNMFRNNKTSKDFSSQENIISSFAADAKYKKKLSTMISNFIDLIV